MFKRLLQRLSGTEPRQEMVELGEALAKKHTKIVQSIINKSPLQKANDWIEEVNKNNHTTSGERLPTISGGL